MSLAEQNRRLDQIYSSEKWIRQPAPEVVRAIVEANPEISEILLAQYNSWVESGCYIWSKDFGFEWSKGFGFKGYDIRKNVSREAVLASFLYFKIAYFAQLAEEAFELLGDNRDAVSVGSLVKLTSGESAHIPMIDFTGTGSSDESLLKLKQALEQDEQERFRRGFLLISGKSFHYYGIDLMPQEIWLEWTKGLLDPEAPISQMIDASWVKKSIDRKCSFLRLAPSRSKPFLPHVVALL